MINLRVRMALGRVRMLAVLRTLAFIALTHLKTLFMLNAITLGSIGAGGVHATVATLPSQSTQISPPVPTAESLTAQANTLYPNLKIASMSPHMTELLYALGLDDLIVGVDRYSNYPPAVSTKPILGDMMQPNLELIRLSGAEVVMGFTANRALNALAKRYPLQLWLSHPANIPELFDEMRHLSRLSDHPERILRQVEVWHNNWLSLSEQYKSKPRLKGYLYLGANPLYTLGGSAFASQALKSCGAENLFAQLLQPSAIVSIESIVLNPPDFVLMGYDPRSSLETQKQAVISTLSWRAWQVQPQQIIAVDQDVLWRPSVRFLEALPQLCTQIDALR